MPAQCSETGARLRPDLDAWNNFERQLWQQLQQDAGGIRGSSRLWARLVDEAEEKWLSYKPWDYTEFKAFVNGTLQPAALNAEREVRSRVDKHNLTIELFPKQDFINPPADLRDPSLVSDPLTRAEVRQLQRRMYNLWAVPIPFTELDRKVACALVQLWMRELRRIPESVRHLKSIVKNNFPHSKFRWTDLRGDIDPLWRLLDTQLAHVYDGIARE